MKVIFLKDVGGVGQRGAVKEVSDGYALNYLIPNGLAQQATADKIAAHEAGQKQLTAQREKEHAALVAQLQSLNGVEIRVHARATEKGGLFKAFGAADIKRVIESERGVNLSPDLIAIEKPFKEIGVHEVVIKTPDAEARLKLHIEKED